MVGVFSSLLAICFISFCFTLPVLLHVLLSVLLPVHCKVPHIPPCERACSSCPLIIRLPHLNIVHYSHPSS